MLKEEAAKKFRNTKMYFNGRYDEVKEKLISMGFKWDMSFPKTTDLSTFPFVYIYDHCVSLSKDMKEFTSCTLEESYVEDLMDIEIDKASLAVYKVYDKVLVRNTLESRWFPAFYAGTKVSENNEILYIITDRCSYKYCLPYEGNEDFLYKV